MPKRKGKTKTEAQAATSASLASRAAAAAPVDNGNHEERATNNEPVWRQLDDFLTNAAPFDCGGFDQVRASTAPLQSGRRVHVIGQMDACSRMHAQLPRRIVAWSGHNVMELCLT